ncbi:MAG TPA: response regulator [Anaerolineales bacterium]|nr:response regulator [Anaerolineales bacterium]
MAYSETRRQQALIIEDEQDLAAIFSKALEVAGYQTGVIHNGQEALDRLSDIDQAPTLVLLDYHLPLVSGDEILHFIRGDRRFAQTRVIMATCDPAAMVDEIENSADLVLLKPISYIQLRQLASRFLLCPPS